MPLSSPSERTEIHHRSLHFRGYRRVDGLFDIECTLVDIKGMDIPLLGTQRIVPAGEPVHAMRIRLALTGQLVVAQVEASSDATPYDICPEAAATLQAVKGLKIGPGWTQAIKERLGGAASCTHLAEMLIAMGTAAYQTVVPYNRLHGTDTDGFELAKKIDSCYAYARTRPLVRRMGLLADAEGDAS